MGEETDSFMNEVVDLENLIGGEQLLVVLS
jgi:hypothetical protein